MPDDTTPPPPLGDGEFIHFEYLFFDPEDAETGFSNLVEVSHDRRMAGDKAARLIADPRVWAIHIRRYEQPEPGVHLYDEINHLAVAQNKAFAERRRAETLQQLLGAAVGGACEMDTKHQRTIAHNEITIEAFSAVIDTLAGMLDAIRQQANRDQRDAVYCEPGDIARMAEVNLGALRASEVRKAKERANLQAEVERGNAITEAENRDRSLPVAAGQPCTRGGCGKPHEDHAGWALGHLWDGSNTKPVPTIVHPQSAPDTAEAEQSPEDVCTCGHVRRMHQDDKVLGGAQCTRCSGDEERSWRHTFRLAVL